MTAWEFYNYLIQYYGDRFWDALCIKFDQEYIGEAEYEIRQFSEDMTLSILKEIQVELEK